MSRTVSRNATISGAAVLVLGAVGATGFWFGAQQAPMQGEVGAKAREALYWYDPMVPDQHFDKPGKSPFMDMQLVPRYAGEPGSASGVRIDPGVAQNLGIRLATVERKPVSASVKASGVIVFNDRDVAVVQARQSGFVVQTRRHAVGDVVAAGDALVELRLPVQSGKRNSTRASPAATTSPTAWRRVCTTNPPCLA